MCPCVCELLTNTSGVDRAARCPPSLPETGQYCTTQGPQIPSQNMVHAHTPYTHVHTCTCIYMYMLPCTHTSMCTRSRVSGVGWMAAVVSLNEMRAGPRFKRGESVAGACSDGEDDCCTTRARARTHTHTHTHSHKCRVHGQFLCRCTGVV